MIHFDLPKEKSSIIKVIGVGGGGSNAVNHMFSQNIDGVNFIICNTDAQAIALSQVPNKIQLGPHLTQGLGAGANPEIGKQATEESLEEIKRILEVNTKMAFITAGMGGGTGTGGAPIISKICKELGILTVGIVTTPFSYEGRKRQIQAEEGIQRLKGYVDTLLVISNDKLRHQYGNLKMKEAFAKADNVLATAAKCITDVISSTGQINVDFADVCTVMKNGGVAILGNAAASGENRAQQAIEEALNSPLLNDNDIRGARWILININSAEGQHEFTMDEVDTIQSYLLSRAGEDSDVILGLGYDSTLGDQIGITLIATGFEYKDPFAKREEKRAEAKKEEKILMTLGAKNEEAKIYDQPVLPFFSEEKREPAPAPEAETPVALQPRLTEEKPEPVVYFTDETDRNITVDNLSITESTSEVDSPIDYILPTEERIELKIVENNSPLSAASGGYLAKPSNIYAEPVNRPEFNSRPEYTAPVNEPIPQQLPAMPQKEEEPSFDMQLVIKDDSTAADQPLAPSTQPSFADNNRTSHAEEPAMLDVAEEQKRKAAERIQKLRNLSFNINAADPNNEFDTVPAYIRRNLELYNTVSPAENFYSNYTVKTDDNNNTQISTINTFLDGKKPD
ncbi:cell division protein FtsZ [Flavihumibacter fluvii]|uniref:cell division protein FtsZ n=1 Tax=Flavihumibacter fluvii TaxID=2838157 RepID=UPI001BDE050C|nr:cell division protein FtsZ [Flavihumibacter fluvii]ULQ52636.1 cell division protein FtsZ [Flavihumibacter fluvii]